MTDNKAYGSSAETDQPQAQGKKSWGDFGDNDNFSEKNVRIRFIRKVYLLLTGLLTFTFGVVAIFVFVPAVKEFAQTETGLIFYLLAYFTFLGLIITFAFCQCCGTGLRKVPYNYMLLGGITVSFSYLLGMISAFHDLDAVLMAAGCTLFLSVGVTIFASQTKIDFTRGCMWVAILLSLALFAFGICISITAIWYQSHILQAVYGGLGAALMSLFLAIDTQLIMGNHRNKYSEEDYINATLQLYLDIGYMFLYLLKLFGGK